MSDILHQIDENRTLVQVDFARESDSRCQVEERDAGPMNSNFGAASCCSWDEPSETSDSAVA